MTVSSMELFFNINHQFYQPHVAHLLFAVANFLLPSFCLIITFSYWYGFENLKTTSWIFLWILSCYIGSQIYERIICGILSVMKLCHSTIFLADMPTHDNCLCIQIFNQLGQKMLMIICWCISECLLYSVLLMCCTA